MAADDEEADNGPRKRLAFDPKLLKTKMNSIELSKKMKSLHEELAGLEQGEVDRDSITAVAKELVNTTLLMNKDRSVKAYVACCLADILSLMAPNAPYTQLELRDIFAFIFRQLKNLGKTSGESVHEQQYYYLLNSLSSAKSACLVCELSNADEQICEAFKNFFDVVGSEMPENVKSNMADILSQLLDESVTVPQDVVEILLSHFNPKQARHKAPSYRLAVIVCSASTDRLARYISQYFTDIFNATAEQISTENDPDLDDLEKAHNLIIELNRVVPHILLNVVPQLEAELQADHLDSRVLATKSLASMFAEAAGSLDHLAKRYPSTWRAWLGRSKDKVVAVRLIVLENLKHIWKAHGDLSNDVQELVSQKLTDPDDKVRLAACTIFSSLEFDTITHHCTLEMLTELADRVKDKKSNVSRQAAKALARIYNLAYPEVATVEPVAIQKFSWIPDSLLTCYLTWDNGLKNTVEAVIMRDILPLPARAEDEAPWVDRYLVVLSTLSEKARIVLSQLSRLKVQPGPSNPYIAFVNACEAYNGGIIDQDADKVTAQLDRVINFLAPHFADPKKASEDLKKFAKMNENRIYKLLQILMNPQSDLKTIIKTFNECKRRIEQSSSTLSDTMASFMRKCGFLLVNMASIPTLHERVKDDAEDEGTQRTRQLAAGVLSEISQAQPLLYAAHTELLRDSVTSKSDNVLLLTECLHALSQLAKVDKTKLEITYSFAQLMQNFASGGVDKQPKYAATILARHEDQDFTRQVAEAFVDNLSSYSESEKLAALQSLNCFAKHAITVLELRQDLLHIILCDEILKGDESKPHDDSVDWVEDEELSDSSRCLIAALKLYTNIHLSPYQSSRPVQTGAQTESMKGVIEYLISFLEVENLEKKFAAADAARLRLQVGFSLLKIASCRFFDSILHTHLDKIASLVQDSCFSVRNLFLSKMVKYMASGRLINSHLNLLFYLAAHDPDEENIALAKKSVTSRFQLSQPDLRLKFFELPFVRFIHLLAHHPDFAQDLDDLLSFTKYISLFLDCIATSTNISLLYHLCSRVRGVRDAASQEHSENIYILSELAQLLIKERAAKHSWTVDTYPETSKVSLPADIFKALPSKDVQQELAKRSWLSNAVQSAITKFLAEHKSDQKQPRVRKEAKTKATQRKRKSDEQQEDAESTDSKHKPSKKVKRVANGTKKSKIKRKSAHDSTSESDDAAALQSLLNKGKKGRSKKISGDMDIDEPNGNLPARRSARARRTAKANNIGDEEFEQQLEAYEKMDEDSS